ncbi:MULTISPECIES: precorrin-6y C5,15-methyltransferase (decarboxylating) subunit CbiE [Clostridium]|uniref:precorrin-6y C5,15-methyltransferase (decarboxylating) subunit CbiE n=1 Tax=Clostridium TaxID=1485 RepID=UPI0008252EF6|nr:MULTISPECIES: precorrin-6y C5,15-methyltransferase (decarboxylating) subunit CbiE [Clostridium]
MIRIIGIGPGNVKYMTFEAVNIIKNSKCIVAFERAASDAAKLNDKIISVNRLCEVEEAIEKNKDVDILASGDPCFFGITDYLTRKKICIDEIVPGLSSFQYMMCKLKKSWQGAELISLHGKNADIQNMVLNKNVYVFLTDKTNTPSYISKKLYSIGVKGRIYSGFNLSYEDEIIIEKNIGDDIFNVSKLSVVVIEI